MTSISRSTALRSRRRGSCSGPRVRIQAPPNLVDLEECRALLAAGVDDFGGISPLTPDHVNPERPWPQIDALSELCAEAGFELRERLTAHPELLDAPWVDPRLRSHVDALRGPDGLADPNVTPKGQVWQEPDGGLVDAGRTDLHHAIDTEGRTTDRRGDFDEVYGDWGEIKARVHSDDSGLASDVSAALRAAERAPSELSDAHALALMTAEGADLEAVCRLADDLRRRGGRRHGHVRRQPEHQLHERLLHRLPVLCLCAAQDRRRRVQPVVRGDPGSCARSRRGRRDRGVHPGRHRPRTSRIDLRRHRSRCDER